MTQKDDVSHLPLAAEWFHTKCGNGRRYLLTPGTRVELNKYDDWEPHDGERLLDQLKPVSFLPKEITRREKHALRLRSVLLRSPLYRQKDLKGGMDYWRALADSCVLAD